LRRDMPDPMVRVRALGPSAGLLAVEAPLGHASPRVAPSA
jgi:hypothetical protein